MVEKLRFSHRVHSSDTSRKSNKMILLVNLLTSFHLACVFAMEDRNLRECGETSKLTKNAVSDFEDSDFRTLTKRAMSVQVAITSGADCNRYDALKCSGVLITRRHVLTSADCFQSTFDRIENRIYKARIGSTDYQQGRAYSILSIKVHENYKAGSKYYNIAMLTLAEAVRDPTVSVICLPDAHLSAMNLTGVGTTAAGWSIKKTDPSNSNSFIFSNMRITTNKECYRLYKELKDSPQWFPKGITSGLVCAYYLEGEKEACDGSVGSPLMFLREGRWYVVGLFIFGGGCGKKNFPNCFTRVSVYADWIRKSVQTCV